MKRIVGDQSAPHQAPQRLDRLAGIAAAYSLMQRVEEACARGLKHGKQLFFALGQRFNQRPLLREQRQLVGEKKRDAPVALADRLHARPRHFARGNQRIEASRRILRNARRQNRALHQRCGQRRALQTLDRIQQPSRFPCPLRRGASSPCQCVRKRASVCCSTGSTSRRSLASDLRRISRSISASHHSR
jgi:hypothetical protein